MPAMTATITAVGGLGMSIAQMVQQDKLKREARASGEAAVRRAKAVEETNMYEGLATPDFQAQKDLLAQREANAISTLQQDARTALGGTIAIERDMAKESAALGQEIAQAEFDKEKLIKGEDAAIEQRRAKRELGIAEAEAKGAGLMEKDAQEAFNQAAGSAVDAAAQLGTEIVKLKKWPDKKDKPD
jgi:hypothetical protein